MNIAHIVENKFKNIDSSSHRMLNSDPVEGVLAAGYIKKRAKVHDHINFHVRGYHGILVLSGTGYYEDANCKHHLKAGDFIQRLPNHNHTHLIYDDNWAEIYVLIGKSLFENLKNINVLTDRQAILHPGIDFETIQIVLNLIDQLNFMDRPELPLLVPKAIGYLTRINYLSRNNQQTSDEKGILSMATQYIEDNLCYRITVEDVASHVNLGYEKFRKLFTNQYRLSPGNYIIHRRINYSQKLLSTGQYSIKEVAYQLGYVDSYTFSKQFKKITGRTPSDFQQLFIS